MGDRSFSLVTGSQNNLCDFALKGQSFHKPLQTCSHPPKERRRLMQVDSSTCDFLISARVGSKREPRGILSCDDLQLDCSFFAIDIIDIYLFHKAAEFCTWILGRPCKTTCHLEYAFRSIRYPIRPAPLPGFIAWILFEDGMGTTLANHG